MESCPDEDWEQIQIVFTNPCIMNDPDDIRSVDQRISSYEVCPPSSALPAGLVNE